MDAGTIVERLERFGTQFPGTVGMVSEADARWKPASGAWSILEIVGHLADEEVEDFRTRVRLTLTEPGTAWPRIDPERVAVERRYNEQDLEAQVARFVRERAESVRWLRGVVAGGADWLRSHTHPRVGPVPAGTLLVSWAAHDALHLRQIAKRMYELAARDGSAAGFEVGYAGEWRA